jgi:hypothetical protein
MSKDDRGRNLWTVPDLGWAELSVSPSEALTPSVSEMGLLVSMSIS